MLLVWGGVWALLGRRADNCLLPVYKCFFVPSNKNNIIHLNPLPLRERLEEARASGAGTAAWDISTIALCDSQRERERERERARDAAEKKQQAGGEHKGAKGGGESQEGTSKRSYRRDEELSTRGPARA